MSKPLTQAEFASLGGIARAKKLSAARRSEIARIAAHARHGTEMPVVNRKATTEVPKS